jgi:hypothetical protein
MDTPRSTSSYSSCNGKGILLDAMTVFEDIRLEVYKFDAQDIVSTLDVWSFNRKLNKDHVQSIYEGLCSQNHPHLIGTIKVIKDMFGDMKVIDGQHRVQALRMLCDTHPDNHIFIFVEMYHVQSLDDDIVFQLFKIANTNLNINVDDDLNMFVVELVNKLATDAELSKGIIDKNDGRVNRPRISKKEMYEALKTNLKMNHLNQSIDLLVSKIKATNTKIGKMSYLELFSRREPSQKRINMKCNADKYGFYLNMEGNFNIDKWISEL